MSTLISGLLDNESFFGRLMSKAAIIIGANFMFLLFSLPVITIGPAFAALCYVMLETLHIDDSLNPFKEFWKGFKTNFKQALIVWLSFLFLALFFYVDLRICSQAEGIIHVFRYGVIMIAIVTVVIMTVLMPVMAAFKDTIPHLLRNAVFFACKKPLKTLVIVFFDVFPLYLTYSDPQYLPLYAFIWCMCGFGAIDFLSARLLYPEFKPFLENGDEEQIDYDEDEEKMIEELRMIDGF